MFLGNRIEASRSAADPVGTPRKSRGDFLDFFFDFTAPLAQLDRASVYGAEGCRFESCGVRHGGPLKNGLLHWRSVVTSSFEQPDDQACMRLALRQANRAVDADEVPVGAVIVCNGRVIGTGYNQREMLADPTAHAEMIALTAAASAVGDWRLDQCTMYVTLEPCTMCAGALVLARMQRLVYGASDPNAGAVRSLYQICSDSRLNHRIDVTGGVLAAECGSILTEYFAAKRRAKKKKIV